MQQLSLIDPRLLPAQHHLSGLRLLVLTLAGLVLTGGHWLVEQQRMTQVMASANAVVEPVEAAAATAPPSDAEIEARILQRQALLDMLAKADQLPRDGAAMMNSVIAALPDTLWLTEVDLVGTAGLRISGGATDPAALRQFAERLARIEPLRGVPLETLRLDPEATETSDAGAPSSRLRFVLASTSHSAPEGRP